jgi:hypothetical protein
MKHALFALGYAWALPTTLIGLLLATAGLCWPCAFRGGVLWFRVTRWSPWMLWARAGFGAITIGGVGILATPEMLPVLLGHELRHFWQARVLGVFFLPVYGACSLWAMLRGKQAYYSNQLEIDARRNS